MKAPSPDITLRYIKPFVFVLCLLPAVFLCGQALMDQLGANPVETILHSTGEWALRLLLLTLCVTPLRRGWRWHGLIRLRRMLGLYAFFYAVLHLCVWVVFEHFFDVHALLNDILKHPYIMVGMAAFLLMLPLAITSNQYMLKRLGGAQWQQLHRLVYLVAIAAVIHFWWKMKLDISEPLIYAVILGILLMLRHPAIAKRYG